jgi:hypothetical protein
MTGRIRVRLRLDELHDYSKYEYNNLSCWFYSHQKVLTPVTIVINCQLNELIALLIGLTRVQRYSNERVCEFAID